MTIIPMDEDILSPSDDYIFKACLTRAELKPALMDLVSAVIGQKVIELELRNNEPAISDIEEKNERLDIFCEVNGGEQVIIEMQATLMEEPDGGHKNFINRMTYYLTDVHSSQPSKSRAYYKLARTYQVTFSMHTVFPDWKDDYLTIANMRTKDGRLISDQINMITVELNKMKKVLKKPVKEMTSLEMWSAFLGYASDKNQREIINEVIKQKEAIGMAGEALMEISRNADERARYLSRRKAESDRVSDQLTILERGRLEGEIIGIQKGEAIGIQKGRAESMKLIVRSLKEAGLPAEMIAKVSNLSVEDIKKLK